MTLPTITIIGTLGADPELRFTNSGVAIASLSIAVNDRKFNRQTNEWEEGEVQWYKATCWREYAENVAHSLVKGARVIATGNLRQRSYETKEGEKRTSFELDVEEVGPALRYATAQVNRSQAARGGSDAGSQAQWASAQPAHENASQGGFGDGDFGSPF